MSDVPDVQDYIDRLNEERGRGDDTDDGDEDEGLSRVGRLIQQENERRGRGDDGD